MNNMFENYRIYFRGLEESDYEHSIAWRQDDEIWDMVVGHRYYVSESFERQWVKKHVENQRDNIVFVVCDKQSGEVAGFVYLNDINLQNRSCHYAKLLGNKAFWGKGYGTEATMLALYYAFYELGLERVEATQLLTNKASIRVNEKCGFKNEGILRHAAFKNGKFVDLNLMGCLREDFMQLFGKIDKYADFISAFKNGVAGYAAMYANNLETKCAYITLIAVKPECQHNGIGGQLLKKCETTAIEKGMDKIRLEVLKDNFKAQNFYKKNGFDFEATQTERSFYMSKSLI